MMKSKFNEAEETPSFAKYMIRSMLWALPLTFTLITGLLAFISFQDALQGDTMDWLIGAGLVVAALAGTYVSWRTMPDFTMGEPNTKRGNNIRILIGGIVAFGIAISVILNLGVDGRTSLSTLFSNTPLPPMTAAAVVGLWLIAMPIFIIFGRRNADEHALQAGDFGLAIGAHVFALIAPAWWMGARGGMLPEPDVMVIFIAVMAVTTIANIWKRAN